MPKSRTRKPKNTRPKTSTSPSAYERRRRSVDLLIDGLTPDYVAWATRDDDELTAFASGQLLVVKMFVTIVSSLGQGAPSLRLDPEHVAGFLPPFLEDVAAAAENEEAAVDDQRYVVGTLVDWLSFLEETDRWEGTAEELEEVADVLDTEAEALGGIVDATPRDDLPVATEEEAADFAANAPFVTLAKSVLDWLGEGREAGEGGEPTRTDLAEVAGIVGSEDRARRLWLAMAQAELVELDGGTIRPGEGAGDLGGPEAMGRLEAQFLGTELVAVACTDGVPGTPEGETSAVLTEILRTAVRQEPFPLEDVASLGSLEARSEEDRELQSELEEELGPEAGDRLKGLSESLLAEIRELEALGLVDTSEGMVAVPVAALDAVYDAVLDYEEDEDWDAPLDEADLEGDEADLEAEGAPAGS